MNARDVRAEIAPPVTLEARVAELAAAVDAMRRMLWPVDASGLPVPTSRERDVTNVDGPRWQVGMGWTVIAETDPADTDGIYLRDYWGQRTGDICSMDPATAIQLAGALLAAARWSGDELRSKRPVRTTERTQP